MKISQNSMTPAYSGVQKKSYVEAEKGPSDQFKLGGSEDTSWMMKDIGNVKSFDSGAFNFLVPLFYGGVGAAIGGTTGAVAGAFLGGGWGSLGGAALGVVGGAAVGAFMGKK